MDRRNFLAVCAALAGMSPIRATAQRSGTVYRVGVLYPGALPPLNPAGREFRQALRELGFVEGDNLVFERRGAGGQYDRLPSLASDLVRLNVDVIVAISPRSVQAARQATTTIPIAMYAVSDPENEAFVATLARPGGNVTGLAHLSFEVQSKMLEMIHELLPNARRLVQFTDGANARLREAAARIGLSLDVIAVTDNTGVEAFFDKIREKKIPRPDAAWFSAIALSGSVVAGPHLQLAFRHHIPDFHSARSAVEAGGLMSYGENTVTSWRRMGRYVGKLLQGAKPSELPVEQVSHIELAINIQRAKALGLTIPRALLLRADQVIE
jgi:ABC-type uncharacterized transport system substrate-binding protein